jgi:hypothetical protein
MLAFVGYLKILSCPLWLYRHFASWAMSHRHRLLRQCRNTVLPSLAISILYLLSYLPLGLLCLLDYFCLLGYFASWATFASWAALPLGPFIDTLPLRLCLIDIVCFDNAGILICLLGYFCLLSYFASWAPFASWACLLGCFASWALYRHFASQAMSHRHCLL